MGDRFITSFTSLPSEDRGKYGNSLRNEMQINKVLFMKSNVSVSNVNACHYQENVWIQFFPISINLERFFIGIHKLYFIVYPLKMLIEYLYIALIVYRISNPTFIS